MKTKKGYGRRTVLAASVVLLLIVIAGVNGVRQLVRYERQRDLDSWQITLGVMADYRARQVLQWVSDQFEELNELASNGSLQIYAQQLQREPGIMLGSEPAQLSYLRNLILATAERYAFVGAQSANQVVPANVAHVADAGLALMAKDMAVIVATPGMPIVTEDLRQAAEEVMESGLARTHDVFLDDQGRALVGFVVPVFALQKAEAAKEVVAVLLAIKSADAALFPLLEAGEAVTTSDEAMLVRREQDSVLYVSPLADGSSPLTKRQPAETVNLDAAHALLHPGSFVNRHDYAGVDVLSTSRVLPGLPWLLVQKISAEEALRGSAAHQRLLYGLLFSVLGIISALLLAAWFYGGKVKGQQIVGKLEERAGQLAAHAHLLRTISDNIGEYLFLTRPNGELIFVNQACAEALGLDEANDACGKTLVCTVGLHPAKQFMALIEKAMGQSGPVVQEMVVEVNGRSLSLHASCIAFSYSTGERDAVLLSLHDLTQLNEAHQKREALLTQIVRAIVRAIDLHDPYSANHSANTATISMAIGRRLGLDATTLHVLETASSICNIGKLFISKGVLSKTGPLTGEEQVELRKEPEFTKDILAGVDFAGPVLETIMQKNELLDGSGHPHGLHGETIIPTARVLAVANAFVAMVSPRAYRDRLSVKEAMGQLLSAGDTKYDRQVVAALFQVTENEIDWQRWPTAECLLGD